MFPKVSILWLNYNSLSFIDIVLESLQAVNELDYPNYELIVVDNGSTDGSFKIIRDFVDKMNVKNKVIKLDKNLGFCGGNNVAYKARDKDSKYVVLLNNDAVPYKNSLKEIIEVMENMSLLGAAQGTILRYDEKTVDTSGDYIDEIFGVHLLFEGEVKTLKKPIYTTYADGAYSFYKVNAIKQSLRSDKLFYDVMFSQYEDVLLGLKLWNNGYKVMSLPFLTAKHNRSSSFRKVRSTHIYFTVRNRVIVNEISNSRYKKYLKALLYRGLYLWKLKLLRLRKEKLEEYPFETPILLFKAIKNGEKTGEIMRKRIGRINIYCAPILKIDIQKSFLGFIFRQKIEEYVKGELNKIKEMFAYEGVK
ncbi:MAG: glycosyltransferase family 2 protein [Candidatus Methanomethylicia archaeon]